MTYNLDLEFASNSACRQVEFEGIVTSVVAKVGVPGPMSSTRRRGSTGGSLITVDS